MPDYQKNILEALHEGGDTVGELEKVVTGEVTGLLSATVLWRDANGIEKFCAKGTTELGKENTPTRETMYFVGSVAKTFTAVAMFHLESQGFFGPVGPEGGLNTNLRANVDRWADYLEQKYSEQEQPNIKDFRRLIKEGTYPETTLMSAIGHRSGIGDNHRGVKNGNKITPGMKDIGLTKYNFKEGTPPPTKDKEGKPLCEYSNAMYALLGMIMEAQLGTIIEGQAKICLRQFRKELLSVMSIMA